MENYWSIPRFKPPSFVPPDTPYVLNADSAKNHFLWFHLSDAVGIKLYILTLLSLKPIPYFDRCKLDINPIYSDWPE